MDDALHQTVTAAHDQLQVRLDRATTAVKEHRKRRETIDTVDAFLIHACRHLGAMCEVALPAARAALTDGADRVHVYVVQARRTEHAVATAKRHLYGESHAITLPWSEVWRNAVTEVHALGALETRLLTDLAAVMPVPAREALAARLEAAVATSPTRPHPHSPHTGRLSHLSRVFWARADRVWDAAEGRTVETLRPVVETEPDSIAS